MTYLTVLGVAASFLSLQVKVAILKYIESLARQMDPTDFVNSSETRLAVSRIITWTTEPKSSDVRKVDDPFFVFSPSLDKKSLLVIISLNQKGGLAKFSIKYFMMFHIISSNVKFLLSGIDWVFVYFM